MLERYTYIGIQLGNQSMSMPTRVWKGIISMMGRVTFSPDDLKNDFE